MAHLGPLTWLPVPLRTERLVLRESLAGDRSAVIDLLASPEVRNYLGGPRPRDEIERAVPENPGHRPGYFIVDLDGASIGIVTFDRRDAQRPGHIRTDGGEAETSYTFQPQMWGCGYATEACAAALNWFKGAVPGELVVLCTQAANDASVRVATKLGFTEGERFEEYGAEQWFGVWSSGSPSV